MSIPKNKILSSTRSINTKAKINSDSQKSNQVQNVNVVVQNPIQQTHESIVQPSYPNIYENIPVPSAIPPVIDRSIEDIQIPLEHEIQDRDNLIKALCLIIDIIRSNPLIINKYIISTSFNLQELILLLTGGEEVNIQFDDPEVGCFCIPDDYLHIKAIYVIKNGSQYIFKHAFPNAVRILDDHRISTKICIFEPEPQTKIIEYNN